MRKRLDSLSIEILEALGVYGPRNISKIARKIGAPMPTVRDRIDDLKSHFSLRLRVSVYHTFIGLKKAFVFAKSNPGCERLLWEALKANDFWLYLTCLYGVSESFYGIYGIPIDHTQEFERFVTELRNHGIAQNVDLLWSTCIQTVNLTGDWYDIESERWIFNWNGWISDIEGQGTTLPPTLRESDNYLQKADRADIIILKELQKDAECRLPAIARLLDVSPQAVQYHFKNHVLKKGLIEGYEVSLPHFEALTDSYCFRFKFRNTGNMAKFALSLGNKPFVRSVGKIYGENALFVRIYLPRKEFKSFADILSKLIRGGFMISYNYVIEDFSVNVAQTIPYEFFEERSWVYDHDEHLKRVENISKDPGFP